jgi:hypothetical protein
MMEKANEVSFGRGHRERESTKHGSSFAGTSDEIWGGKFPPAPGFDFRLSSSRRLYKSDVPF